MNKRDEEAKFTLYLTVDDDENEIAMKCYEDDPTYGMSYIAELFLMMDMAVVAMMGDDEEAYYQVLSPDGCWCEIEYNKKRYNSAELICYNKKSVVYFRSKLEEVGVEKIPIWWQDLADNKPTEMVLNALNVMTKGQN